METKKARKTRKTRKKRNVTLIWPLLTFIVFALFIALERNGISYNYSEFVNTFLPQEIIDMEKPELEIESLILYDTRNKPIFENIADTFGIINVGYLAVNVDTEAIPAYGGYKTVVLVLQNSAPVIDEFVSLIDWVDAGGRVMISRPLDIPEGVQKEILPKLGIVPLYLVPVLQEEATQLTDFMPGGKGRQWEWDIYEEGDGRYGYNAQLTSDCTLHMEAMGDVNSPLLWEHEQGDGKIVYNNNDAFFSRLNRGMIASAYSLLEDTFVYPVINASMFFIDDFPAPIPDGTNEYIYRDFKVSIDYFYTNIWFPDMMKLARDYDLKYTGMLIETYDDHVEAPFSPINKTHGFEYFGAMLLDEGFEMALHGYNHMPLVLEDFDYRGHLPYKKWKTAEDIEEALAEVERFAEQYYPEVTFKTYIPPSNVISVEGRAALKAYLPDINCVSGLYDDLYFDMHEDFGIGEDGLINLPRISSGFMLEENQKSNVIDTIALYYTSSHFIHPDDPFDKDRGGEAGWKKMKESIEEHLDWLKTTSPNMRNMTAQEGAMAVQRFSKIALFKSVNGSELSLDIKGFYDEAWFLMRCNEGMPVSADGATIFLVSENLYLVHAVKDHVKIQLSEVTK